MSDLQLYHSPRRRNFILGILAAMFVLALGIMFFATVYAGPPLDVAGYLGPSYSGLTPGSPTGEKPESKLWWNDGSWWGILYSPNSTAFKIYRLDMATQDWIDTGVTVDDRTDTRADVLWDDATGKLYVASHVRQLNPGTTNNPDNWARLYRFSYDAGTQSYSLDSGFSNLTINDSKTETLVLDKDATGRLWITYTTRENGIYEVFVNATTSAGDDTAWGIPFSLSFAEATVGQGDISTLIAFTDNGGAKVGVMWNNSLDDKYYFASHDVSQAPADGWTLETDLDVPFPSNDHINLAKTSSGQVLAAIKTFATEPTDPLVAVVARDVDGTFSFHPIKPADSIDTRPIVVIDEQNNDAYVFASSKPGGGWICYHVAEITTPLSAMSFPISNCGGVGPTGAAVFIADTTYDSIHNATSTKQNVNGTSNLVVLASDDNNEQVYVHNVMALAGGPDPIPTATATTTGEPGPTSTPSVTPTVIPGLDEFNYLPIIRR